MLPGGGFSVAVALVVLVLAAAKAHGRQVRLARERAGVMAVDFRKDNGPVVEAIWRQDRIVFWVSAVAAGLPLLVTAVLGKAFPRWPLWGAVPVALVLGFASGFIGAGLVAWVRQLRRRPKDPAWLGRANLASLGWWALVAAALALVVLAVI